MNGWPPDMHETLLRLTQKVERQTLQLATLKDKARKAATREKIELGGLVIKAHCQHLPKAVLLGGLLSIGEDISRDEALQSLFAKKGERAFMGFDEKNMK